MLPASTRRILIIAILAAIPIPTAALADDDDQGGYVSLFNGENLDGWVIENQGRFSARDERLILDQGTGWLRSDRTYADFILRLDFRFLEPGANSGIFVRTGPTSADDENGWPDNGYQVQCMETTGGPYPCGSIIPYGAPPFESRTDVEALTKAYHPVGEWNSYQIECIGERLNVKLNGTIITTATNIKNRRGHIGIQGEHGRLEFRNLQIKPVK